MFSLRRQRSRDRSAPRRIRARAAFSLIEVVIALSVLGTMASGCYIGFNSINTYAVTTRLYSEALTAAQNQIDTVLSKEPFDVLAAYMSGSFAVSANKVPIELMTTTELDALAASGVVFPTSPPSSRPAATDPYYPYYPYYRTGKGQPILKEAFIYQDATTGTILVRGTLTTSIVDTGMTMDFLNSSATPPTPPAALNTRKGNVTVSYVFRNRSYAVSMDTLRTADQ